MLTVIKRKLENMFQNMTLGQGNLREKEGII